MQNTFVRLGNMVINLEHITHIAKIKGENGYYYNLYTAGKSDPLLQFKEASAEGKALHLWFERVSPLAYTDNDIPMA